MKLPFNIQTWNYLSLIILLVFDNLEYDSFIFLICRIHKEQVEKWQEEIKELRALDASNEEANALLQNARYVLQLSRND